MDPFTIRRHGPSIGEFTFLACMFPYKKNKSHLEQVFFMKSGNCEGRFSTVCETNPLENDKYQKLERVHTKYDSAYAVLSVYQI